MSDDYNPFEHLTEEQKSRPYTAYTGLDENRWDGQAINPNYDAETYGAIPEEAPPEWPIPEDILGAPKYIRDGSDWVINPDYKET